MIKTINESLKVDSTHRRPNNENNTENDWQHFFKKGTSMRRSKQTLNEENLRVTGEGWDRLGLLEQLVTLDLSESFSVRQTVSVNKNNNPY